MQSKPSNEIIKKNKYVFPNVMAKFIAKVDARTQMEGAMLSMTFMMIGIILTTVYLIFFSNFATIFKILLAFNLVCGLAFMFTNLITTYQSYLAYMEIKEFQDAIEKVEKINAQNDLKGGKINYAQNN